MRIIPHREKRGVQVILLELQQGETLKIQDILRFAEECGVVEMAHPNRPFDEGLVWMEFGKLNQNKPQYPYKVSYLREKAQRVPGAPSVVFCTEGVQLLDNPPEELAA